MRLCSAIEPRRYVRRARYLLPGREKVRMHITLDRPVPGPSCCNGKGSRYDQEVYSGTKQNTFVQPLSAWSRITMEKCHARWRTYSRFLALPVRLPTLFWVMPLGLSRDSWLTRTLVALHDASAGPAMKTRSKWSGI